MSCYIMIKKNDDLKQCNSEKQNDTDLSQSSITTLQVKNKNKLFDENKWKMLVFREKKKKKS